MLDLSQYTGSRLKQKIWVLEVENGEIYSKRTRDATSKRTGGESRALIALFRLAPEFPLARLSDLSSMSDSVGAAIERILQPGVTRTASELVSEIGATYREVITSLDDLVGQKLLFEAEVEGRQVFRLATERPSS
jgi:hypothetical protein